MNDSAQRQQHEQLHGAGRIWLDGDGDEWVEVEPGRYVMHGRCGKVMGDPFEPYRPRRTYREIAQRYKRLSKSTKHYVIEERP